MGPSSPGRPGFLGELECLAEKHQKKGHLPLVEPPIPLQLQVATPVALASRSCSSWTQGKARVTPSWAARQEKVSQDGRCSVLKLGPSWAHQDARLPWQGSHGIQPPERAWAQHSGNHILSVNGWRPLAPLISGRVPALLPT